MRTGVYITNVTIYVPCTLPLDPVNKLQASDAALEILEWFVASYDGISAAHPTLFWSLHQEASPSKTGTLGQSW